MKILITEPDYFPKDLQKELENYGTVVAKKMKHEELVANVKDVDVLLVRVETSVNKEVLDNAEKLKLIGSMTTGLDHVDIEGTRQKGIELINFPGYATSSTAQYVFTLILNMMRKVPWAFEHFKDEKWERHKFLGRELTGKTLGVIGFGRIGSTVGKYAKSFGMNVIFYDPYVKKEVLSNVEAEQVDSVDKIIEQSDIITLHTFLSNETRGMFDKEAFSKMKNSAILVNTSRGEIVNDNDLVTALRTGEISGAALDVFSEEPLPVPNNLINYAREKDNLLLTPHLAGSTSESIESAAKFMVEKIREFSETPSNKTLTNQ